MQTDSPRSSAHDSFTRLLHHQGPDAEALWTEAEALVIDDSTLARTYARQIDPVTCHCSGKHREVISGINLITLLWPDVNRKFPVDNRVFSKVAGKARNDPFWEMMLMARGRVYAPDYVLFDSWYARLENLKKVRGHGWRWVSRQNANRKVTPEDRVSRTLEEVTIGLGGVVVLVRGYGLIRVFRTDDPDGVAGYRAINELGRETEMRQHHAELSFAIENDHRELKQNCGVEKCQARSEPAQPHRLLVAGVLAAGMADPHHRDQRVRGETQAHPEGGPDLPGFPWISCQTPQLYNTSQ